MTRTSLGPRGRDWWFPATFIGDVIEKILGTPSAAMVEMGFGGPPRPGHLCLGTVGSTTRTATGRGTPSPRSLGS